MVVPSLRITISPNKTDFRFTSRNTDSSMCGLSGLALRLSRIGEMAEWSKALPC